MHGIARHDGQQPLRSEHIAPAEAFPVWYGVVEDDPHQNVDRTSPCREFLSL